LTWMVSSISEFQSAACYMLNAHRGNQLKWQNWNSWDWAKHQVSKEDWQWLWTEGVRMGLFRYGHVVKGGILGVQKLAALGHELLVVTHRPKQAVRDTIAWLHHVDLPFSEVHILSDGQPKSTVEADVLIDDKPENCMDWPRRSLLFDQPWNQDFVSLRASSTRRVYGWEEVPSALRN